jgi:hypothetical protein
MLSSSSLVTKEENLGLEAPIENYVDDIMISFSFSFFSVTVLESIVISLFILFGSLIESSKSI